MIANILFTKKTFILFLVGMNVWCIAGQLTGFDPYPFLFISTFIGQISILLMILIGIEQKEAESRDKMHQEQHERIELLLLKKIDKEAQKDLSSY